MKTLFKLTYYSLNAFVVLGFLWLGHTSYHAKPLTMAQLVQRSLAEEKAHRAAMLQDAWQLSDNDVSAPVNLFGENGRVK